MPARPEPKYLGSRPDQTEGAQVLASFRNVGIHGAYWLKFELRVMPRKGDERVLSGEMFGTQGADGPLTHLRVDDAGSPSGAHEQRYLLHGGANPAAWTWRAGTPGAAQTLRAADWLARVQDTDLTLFDLQMPFLRWADFIYEGVANVRGRPAHAYLLYPPADFPATGPGQTVSPAAVRVYLDTQFSALTQAEWLGADGKALKTVTVLDLKKVGEQWLVKSIDLRNHQTRAKTRFSATAAALDLILPAETFAPENLSSGSPAVPAEKVERL